MGAPIKQEGGGDEEVSGVFEPYSLTKIVPSSSFVQNNPIFIFKRLFQILTVSVKTPK
jgi:hypothetical protein